MKTIEQPNIDYIEKISYKNPKFKHKIITIIKEELPVEIDLYRHYLKARNYIAAANMVHKLKHKIVVFGIDEGYSLAKSFEDNLREGNVAKQKDFEIILILIEDFVKKI